MIFFILFLGMVGGGAYYIQLEFFKIIHDKQIKIDKNKNLLSELEATLENHKKIFSKEILKIKEDISVLKLKDSKEIIHPSIDQKNELRAYWNQITSLYREGKPFDEPLREVLPFLLKEKTIQLTALGTVLSHSVSELKPISKDRVKYLRSDLIKISSDCAFSEEQTKRSFSIADFSFKKIFRTIKFYMDVVFYPNSTDKKQKEYRCLIAQKGLKALKENQVRLAIQYCKILFSSETSQSFITLLENRLDLEEGFFILQSSVEKLLS